MDYEQKYKEALEWARKVMQGQVGFVLDEVLEKFPELKESEDEKIRKVLLNDFKNNCSEYYCEGVNRDMIIAWLEKQGEQKQVEYANGDDYGIDGLWHAINILEKTLGKVDGYQTDDGILEHECAITAVAAAKADQKPVEWSEEDEEKLELATRTLLDAGQSSSAHWVKALSRRLKSLRPQNWTKEDKERYISCLQRLGTGNPEQPETINSKWFKEHVYPQPSWKPSEEQIGVIEAVINNRSFQRRHLDSLYADLKKLKEE